MSPDGADFIRDDDGVPSGQSGRCWYSLAVFDHNMDRRDVVWY